MSGIATAMIAGAVVTGAAAKRAGDQASAAAESELGFAQRQYDDWQAIYGPIQENLSEYYSNLSPDAFAAQGIQYAEEEYAKALEATQANLAQRGITDSGIAADIERQSQYDLAETKAAIRYTAPEVVNQQKMSFLTVGMGNDPSGMMQNALGRNADRTRADANNANAAFGNSLASLTNYGLQQLKPTGVNLNQDALAGTPYIDYNEGLV